VVQVWRKSIWVDGFDDFVSLLLMDGSSQGRAGFYILLMGVSLKMALATLAFLILRDLSLFYLLHLPFRHLIYFTRADEQNLKVFYTADFGHLQATQFKWNGLEVSPVTWPYRLTLLAFPAVYFPFLIVLKICYLAHPQNTLYHFVFAGC
jgi:hypothetical protein